MPVGLLNLGTSALLANQAALQTAGNNIANVHTPGYSRQSVVVQQVEGQYSGAGYIGKGVAVTTVMRNYDAFLTSQSNLATAQLASDSTLSTQMTQLENVFSSGAGDLGSSVNALLNSFSAVASAPTDLTARTAAIGNANQMASQFNASSASLDTLQAGTKMQLQQSVASINSLATQIAAVNEQIARTMGSGQPPNSLLDQRDQLVSQLNQYVQTTSIPASDGTVTIFLAGSQPLVQGKTANALSVATGAFPGDASTSTLTINQAGQSMPMDESNLGGGSVKGLMTFMNQDLVNGRNLLGRMALAIGTVVNNQQRLGLDLSGNPGGNLFRPSVLPAGLPASTNSPQSVGPPAATVAINMSVSDPTALAVSDYQLTFSSTTAGSITRLSDGVVTNFATLPAQVDGLTVSSSTANGGVFGPGDIFLLKPFSAAASLIRTALIAPTALAAASQIQASAGSSNTGGLAVTSLQAQTANVNLTHTVNLTFNATNGTFDAVDNSPVPPALPITLATAVAYTPGQPISYNGWTLILSGLPKTGDTLTVGPSDPKYVSTNSGNATAMVNLRDMPLFDKGPLADGYASAIAQVGLWAQSAAFAATTSQSIATSAQTAQAAVSGVNLDEEAANLLQFQQAYQAAAKMMSVSQTLFTSLMGAFGA